MGLQDSPLVTCSLFVALAASGLMALTAVPELSGYVPDYLRIDSLTDTMSRRQDGSAYHPEAFRDVMRENTTHLKKVFKEHPDWIDIVMGDSLEGLQQVLRDEKRERESMRASVAGMRADNEAERARKLEKCRRKNAGGPPEYCERKVARKADPVLKRMKMMGPEPTKDDAYNQVQPEVPMHMRCDACQAIVHQGALALSKAFAERKRDDKVTLLTIETLEVMCSNHSMWIYDYGYAATPSGVNSLIGAGVATSEHWTDEDGDVVVPQTMHSDGIGKRMQSACLGVLLGVAPDEEEIATAVLDAADTAAAATALRDLACSGPDQPCHVRAS